MAFRNSSLCGDGSRKGSGVRISDPRFAELVIHAAQDGKLFRAKLVTSELPVFPTTVGQSK